MKTGIALEQDNVTVGYPRYQLHEGTLYEKAATNKEYRTTFKLDSNNKEVTLTYSASNKTNVVYLCEGENVSGAKATSAGNNMVVRSSNAACGYTSSDVMLARRTLPSR